MKEESLFIEERVGQVEEQLEICAEALETIFMHLKYVNESVEALRDHIVDSQIMSVSAPPPGWEPRHGKNQKKTGNIMGKKRRVLNNPKFAKLREHPKYAGMIAARQPSKEESYEAEVEQPKPEFVKETEIVEVALVKEEPKKVVKLEKPKPTPEAKPKLTKKKVATKTKRSKK